MLTIAKIVMAIISIILSAAGAGSVSMTDCVEESTVEVRALWVFSTGVESSEIPARALNDLW